MYVEPPPPRAPFAVILVILASLISLVTMFTAFNEPSVTVGTVTVSSVPSTTMYAIGGAILIATYEESFRIERSSIVLFGYATVILNIILVATTITVTYNRVVSDGTETVLATVALLVAGFLYLGVYVLFRPRFLTEAKKHAFGDEG